MVFWRRVAVGTILVAHQAVIEGNGRPYRYIMAGGTISAKLALMRFILGMAAYTSWRGAFVGAARMAGAALQVVVASLKREKIMLQ